MGMLGYLRFFEQPRIFMTYITASLKSMIPFMVVVVIMLTAFSLALAFSRGRETVSLATFVPVMQEQYLALFGEFYDAPDGFEWMILFIMSLIMPLTMLNLLIAIISEAHANVQQNLERNDNAHLADIILELEVFMVWNRARNDRSNMIYCEYDD
jgi:hypothetical protein